MRYQVVNGSQNGHGCCFEATVVDTTRPVMIGGQHYKDQHEPVCECFELADAERIAAALNAAAGISPPAEEPTAPAEPTATEIPPPATEPAIRIRKATRP